MKAEVVIIGAGPAGLTAAIQLARYQIPFVMLEKESVGGLLRNANLVENYPGFPNGIPGGNLVRLFEQQLRRVGAEVTFEAVTALDFAADQFNVETRQGQHTARFAVIASGTRPRPLSVSIQPAARSRVFSEVHPLLEMSQKEIVIIGAGDAAFDYALNLSRQNRVTILNHGEQVKCLPLLWERAVQTASITYHARMRVSRVDVDEGDRLKVCCAESAFACDYVIFAIGREPQCDFLSQPVRAQERSLVESGKLYFIGDVRNGLFRQTAIAAGDGLRAAMQIYQYIHRGEI